MKKILYSGNKNIYKANLHNHTTVSDGNLTPEEIKKIYMEKGYSIIAYTDHDELVSQEHLSDDNFLAIASCEVSISQSSDQGKILGGGKTYHLNLYATKSGVTKTPPLPTMDYHDIDAINEYISDRTKEGFLVSYNHPYWSLQTYEDYAPLKGCFAMEIYNHNCEVDEAYYGYAPQVYDEMLRTNHRLYCLATDDNHNNATPESANYDSFGGWVCINSESLKYEDIMNALETGDFYSSQGPEIHEIYIEDNSLNVKCSPCDLIVVYTQSRGCLKAVGKDLTSAKFELPGDEQHIRELFGDDQYIRIMCRDAFKKDATSNAYWL